MAGPLVAAGAAQEPSEYATLSMAEQFTGLWTQRVPFRDAAVPYLYSKFYGATRFDAMIDGINREINSRLGDARRPGNAVWNASDVPAGFGFASWKYIQNGVELVRTLLDTQGEIVIDFTDGAANSLLSKAGAVPAKLLGVGTELFMGDGSTQQKVLASSKTWLPYTSYSIGDFIVASNGSIQVALANPVSYTIADVAVISVTVAGSSLTYLVLTFTGASAPAMDSNRTCSFSGLTAYTALNGQTLTWQGINANVLAQLNLAANQLAFQYTAAPYAEMADTGAMVAEVLVSGTSGATEPAWSGVYGHVTNDGGLNGGVNWTECGLPTQNWGITPVPPANPSYAGPIGIDAPGLGSVRYWRPGLAFSSGSVTYSILDPNGNVQVLFGTGSVTFRAGIVLPSWSATTGTYTPDNKFTWLNYGPIASSWYAATAYGGTNATTTAANPCVILDSNGNLQGVQAIATAEMSGSTVPAWATVVGATTSDGGVTWICLGPGSVLWSGVLQYSWSAVGIDGTVSTAAPITLIANGGLGANAAFELDLTINLAGTSAVTDPQVKQLNIWRTVQGGSTLILLDTIPNPYLLGQSVATYRDVFSDLQLGENIASQAPVALTGNPPPVGFVPCCYALGRIWGTVGNMVVWSAGPDAITGNGLTQFPPLNFIAYIGKPWDIFPITVQDGGQVVFTSSGTRIILGSGSTSDPFYDRAYFQSVSVAGPNCVTLFNQMFFVIEANLKVSAMAVEFPFQPSTGYTEIGFPIGDQFQKVTTGGLNAALFTAAGAFVSWNNQGTSENALYVSDGAGHWFRMAAAAPPESGWAWSPLAEIEGGASAVQSVETAPGIFNLLLAPQAGTSGPILARDTTGTVFEDNGASYPSWDVKGNIVMCQSGETAEIAHIATKSKAVGNRPQVSLLMNETQASTARPFVLLELECEDPPNLDPSLSYYSDRYKMQGDETPLCDNFQMMVDYGVQNVADELQMFSIFGAKKAERKQQ